MANVEHSSLSGSDLHEPKGIDDANNGTVYVADGDGSGAFVFPNELIGVIRDEKAEGDPGGDFVSGGDRTRDLNDLMYDKYNFLDVSDNQFTIEPPDGMEFIIEWSAPAFNVGNHQSFLHQTSGSEQEIARGTSEKSNSTDFMTRSFGVAHVDIAAPTTYEIRHVCSSTHSSTGFGDPGEFGNEIYTLVKIYRVG